MGISRLSFEKPAEPPNLGIRLGILTGKPYNTVEIDGHEVELISVRLDTSALPPLMPTWLFLRLAPERTLLLHTCGAGSGWQEVDEGAPAITIRSGASPRHFTTFTCLCCTSTHCMLQDGSIIRP